MALTHLSCLTHRSPLEGIHGVTWVAELRDTKTSSGAATHRPAPSPLSLRRVTQSGDKQTLATEKHEERDEGIKKVIPKYNTVIVGSCGTCDTRNARIQENSPPLPPKAGGVAGRGITGWRRRTGMCTRGFNATVLRILFFKSHNNVKQDKTLLVFIDLRDEGRKYYG